MAVAALRTALIWMADWRHVLVLCYAAAVLCCTVGCPADTEVDDYTATSLLLQFTDLKGLYLRCSVLQTTAVLAVIPRLTTVQCLQLMGWGDMGQEIDMRDAQLLQLVPLQQLKRLQLPLVSQCSREAVDQFLAGMSQLRLLSVKADEAEDWSNPVMFW